MRRVPIQHRVHLAGSAVRRGVVRPFKSSLNVPAGLCALLAAGDGGERGHLPRTPPRGTHVPRRQSVTRQPIWEAGADLLPSTPPPPPLPDDRLRAAPPTARYDDVHGAQRAVPSAFSSASGPQSRHYTIRITGSMHPAALCASGRIISVVCRIGARAEAPPALYRSNICQNEGLRCRHSVSSTERSKHLSKQCLLFIGNSHLSRAMDVSSELTGISLLRYFFFCCMMWFLPRPPRPQRTLFPVPPPL